MAEAPDQPGAQEQEELLGAHNGGTAGSWTSEDKDQDHRLQCQDGDEDGDDQGPQPSERETLLKAEETPELDEDEGFGDWSQKPEHPRQNWGVTADCRAPPQDESPEGQRQENRSPQPGYGDQDGDSLSVAGVCLEEVSPQGQDMKATGPPGADQDPEECEESSLLRTPSLSTLEGVTQQGSPPLSPAPKLTDRTESLNRCVERSNSVKRSQPDLPISRIDGRLEQYTQAIETAVRTPKLTRQPSIELPSMAVASTKSLWETGEVQAQSASRAPACKDIVAGDLSKKVLWEQKGAPPAPSTAKSTLSGKRYKFVATGHGKYEKVLVD